MCDPDQGSTLFPALAGGFFTTEPPGKPYPHFKDEKLELWTLAWSVLASKTYPPHFLASVYKQWHFTLKLHPRKGVGRCLRSTDNRAQAQREEVKAELGDT